MDADIIDDAADDFPHGDGLSPQQRAQLDAVLQRLDAALVDVPPAQAAVARAQIEIGFLGNLHLDRNTRQYVIAQREALRDDMAIPLATIDRGLNVSMAIVERLLERVGEPPDGDPRSVMARLEAGAASRERQGRAIRAIFILIALALFFGLLAIGIAVLAQPQTAAIISGSSVAGASWGGLRLSEASLFARWIA